MTGSLLAGRVDAAWNHACAVDAETFGALSCWGFNNRGQLGDGTNTWQFEPKGVDLP